MRTLRVAAAILAVLGVGAGAAYGQAGAPGIKVKVPFRFSIGKADFAAGEYSIFSKGEKIWVQEENGRNVAVAFGGNLNGKMPESDGKVIFACYAGDCFLSQVWIAGTDAGRGLPKSNREIQLASQETGQEIALLGTKPLR